MFLRKMGRGYLLPHSQRMSEQAEQLPEAAVRPDRQHRIALLKRNLLNLLREEGPDATR